MDKQKLQTLLYDLQKAGSTQNAHDMIMKYADDESSTKNGGGNSGRIKVENFAIDTIFGGHTDTDVRVKLNIPLDMMTDKTFTFKNKLVK